MQKKSHEKNTNVFLMLRPFMLTLQNIKIEKNVVKKIVDKKIIESILLPKSRAPPTEQIPEQMVEPIINKVKPIAVVKSVEEKGKLFSPRQKDSLFWC